MRQRRPERAEQYESPAYLGLSRGLAVSVRALRAERGWTQEEAAHRSGMATRLLQGIETQGANVTPTTLARLCSGFDVDPLRLFALGDDPVATNDDPSGRAS